MEYLNSSSGRSGDANMKNEMPYIYKKFMSFLNDNDIKPKDKLDKNRLISSAAGSFRLDKKDMKAVLKELSRVGVIDYKGSENIVFNGYAKRKRSL